MIKRAPAAEKTPKSAHQAYKYHSPRLSNPPFHHQAKQTSASADWKSYENAVFLLPGEPLHLDGVLVLLMLGVWCYQGKILVEVGTGG